MPVQRRLMCRLHAVRRERISSGSTCRMARVRTDYRSGVCVAVCTLLGLLQHTGLLLTASW